ncbi:MAG: zeta toxin family protein [Myxococcota bacterium]
MMKPFEALWQRAWESGEVRECYASLSATAPESYRRLATFLVCEVLSARSLAEASPRMLAIGGGQGAGKTTLSELIAEAMGFMGKRVCLLSLDDFYSTRVERVELARSVHPLFETRGPPGTHDVALLNTVLDQICAGRTNDAEVVLPVFDKSLDDRSGERVFAGSADWVVLEGWCVGARALNPSLLARPLNTLEEELDPLGVWRRAGAQYLEESYVPLWSRFERTLFLRVPDLSAVRRWRLDQERARPEKRRMGEAQVAEFVQYYERITRSMWEQEPLEGQLTAWLGEGHEVLDLEAATPRPDSAPLIW